MMRRYAQLPPVVPTPLEQGGYSWFSVIVPIARTNLVTNPSVETNTTGYTAGAGTLTRTTEQQYHGAYSLKYVPAAAVDDFFFYGTVSLTSGTLYAISCKFLGASGVKYRIQLTDNTGATALVTYFFTGTGRWQWVWMYWLETSTTTRRIYFAKNLMAGNTQAFYVDGVQCEALANASETVSTYIDGDQTGLVPNQQPPAYIWNGTPHASTSSRSGLTRAGGMVVPLNAYSFLLASVIGLGLALPQNVRTDYARIDGAFDDYTRKPTRQFTLLGRLSALASDAVDSFRSDLGAVVDRDRSALDQRLMLRYQKLDACGVPRSNAAVIDCKYLSGLEGNTDNHFQQDVPISFEQYLPLVAAEGEAGSALSVQISVSNANDILTRSPGGVWSALGTGASGGVVQSIVIGLDGKVYAAGTFTGMGGVANTSRIAYWDGVVWNAMGTGANGTVQSLAVGPDGSIYAAGAFTLMDGVANTARIARWNGSAWSALGTGITTGASTAYAVAVAPNGNVYVTGDFLAPATRIAVWNGSVWSGLGTGLNDLGDTLVFDAAGNLFVGGDFTTANGVSAARVAMWNGTTFVALAAGLNASVIGLAIGANGILYATGIFTNTGYPNIAQWNGVSWSAVGGGLNGNAYGILAGQGGLIYVGGIFTASGSITFPDSFAVWNGATFTATDVDLPASSNVRTIAQSPAGALYIGYNQTGTATAAAVTTVTNGGTARTYPTLKVYGPSSGTSRIYQIKNYTTGWTIYLNYTIAAGEVATFVFRPDALSFTSTFVGNLASKILPGSSEANFFLQPGANIISFYAADSSVTDALQWRPQYTSLDGLTR